VECSIEMKQWEILRWLGDGLNGEDFSDTLPRNSAYGADESGRHVMLFASDWSMRYFLEKNPSVRLFETPHAAELTAV